MTYNLTKTRDIIFSTSDQALQSVFDNALAVLKKNLTRVCNYSRDVLIEGAEYRGVWLECAPHEGALYGALNAEIALDNHRVFFQNQREDGCYPAFLWEREIGFWQVQAVVPIGKTALEVFENTGDEEFLETAYASIARWDSWLRNYRDTRGTGLVEVFCEWDTGHDNSPRLRGLPQGCPNGDSRVCPQLSQLPLLAPDLSATAYGNRRALAKIARVLGKENEAARWDEDAVTIRAAIFQHCFDKDDLCFYDRDANGDLVRVRGDALSRVLCEHVVEPELFEAIYARHIRNPAAFWTPFPLPSIAANDPHFVQPIPPNSWGGASQALTALRAPRWFSHYGKHADLRHLMTQWLDALSRSAKFSQQIDPWSGEFTPSSDGYSPAMLCALDFLAHLYGVRREARVLAWSCDAGDSRYQLSWDEHRAAVEHNCDGCRLLLDGVEIARVTGTCSLESDEAGAPLRVINTTAKPQTLTITTPRATFSFSLAPDETRVWMEIEMQPEP